MATNAIIAMGEGWDYSTSILPATASVTIDTDHVENQHFLVGLYGVGLMGVVYPDAHLLALLEGALLGCAVIAPCNGDVGISILYGQYVEVLVHQTGGDRGVV